MQHYKEGDKMNPGDKFILVRPFPLNDKLYNPPFLAPGTEIEIVEVRPGPSPKSDFTNFVKFFYTVVEFIPLDGPYVGKHFNGGKSTPCPFDH